MKSCHTRIIRVYCKHPASSRKTCSTGPIQFLAIIAYWIPIQQKLTLSKFQENF